MKFSGKKLGITSPKFTYKQCASILFVAIVLAGIASMIYDYAGIIVFLLLQYSTIHNLFGTTQKQAALLTAITTIAFIMLTTVLDITFMAFLYLRMEILG